MSKLNSARRDSRASSRLDAHKPEEQEYEWLLCLSSAYQTAARLLFESGRPPMRAGGNEGVFSPRRLRGGVWRSVTGWATRKAR
jgi:hypothetical protein